MRILFTIPHYYQARSDGGYGSLRSAARSRRTALAAGIFALHATFGRRQGFLAGKVLQSNADQSSDIDVAVCTTGERHLIGELPLPAGLFRHHATQAAAPYLGFECHALLAAALGRYDWYCYLEDDLLLTDALFFQKLEWFNRLAGDEAVLLPNRFEADAGHPIHKLYIDGPLARPEWSERWQDIEDRRAIEAEAFGFPVRLQRVGNPHSGCFFLNARQMAHWATQPTFLAREPSFVGPLETAATFGVMHHFRVYKPARENAGFLELRHLDRRYLGVRVMARPANTAEPAT